MLMEQLTVIDRSRFIPYLITILPNPTINLAERIPNDVEYIQFQFSKIYDVVSLYELWSYFRREKFDAIVTSLFNANLVGRVAGICAGVPVILSSELNVSGEKKKWQIIADRFLSYFTKKILVSSNEVLEFTSKQEGINKRKFQVNFNAIPLKLNGIKKMREQILQKRGLPTDLIYIVTAGRLVEQKGHRYLIDAAAEMKQIGMHGFRILIFGRGVLKDVLLQQITSSHLTEEVQLMGVATMEEILAISDIFTLPSLWEGLSIALLQSMDSGSPIVATRVSGTNEALQDKISALLVDPGDTHQLTETFKKLLEDELLRQKIARGAHERVKKFSIDENVKVIENLILFTNDNHE